MTASVPFSRPVRPSEHPGDAERAPRELMTLPGASRDVRRWRLVEIRLGGQWRPGMLTVWRRPPGSAVWVVHVQWGEGDNGPGTERWGWFLYNQQTIRPAPEPNGAPPSGAPHFGRWRDAVVVPSELAGEPAPDDADRCWRLAWVRAGGQWRSGLVTVRRQPGPGLPWIARVRLGEDTQWAWVVADGTTLRPVDAPGLDTGPTADTGRPARPSQGPTLPPGRAMEANP
ncbi:hypothetical protein OH807_30400 [Kitasatospora sp. NBC_01560]|uniref:hypothetical protein n=1 Tax=Kitasatospora sp. NBC_01560 TaxID=2975965 RepID=UPI00386FCC6D